MQLLEERILNDGTVLGENVLKVDSFLTHQVDTTLMKEIGKTFVEAFQGNEITKVVTIEASGISPALYVAELLGVPMIFAKKHKNLTLNDELLTTEVYSFTKQVTTTVSISKKYLNQQDNVLIIDDFLANGQAGLGLIRLCEQVGANVIGVGIIIEKSFQDGREKIQETGKRVVSLARIQAFQDGKVVFTEADA